MLAAFALMVGVRGLPVAQLPRTTSTSVRAGPDAGRRPSPERHPAVPAGALAIEGSDGALDGLAEAARPGQPGAGR